MPASDAVCSYGGQKASMKKRLWPSGRYDASVPPVEATSQRSLPARRSPPGP